MIKLSEMRRSSPEQLRQKLIELRRRQLELRIQHVTGQFSDVARFRELRRDIARIKTVMNEQTASDRHE